MIHLGRFHRTWDRLSGVVTPIQSTEHLDSPLGIGNRGEASRHGGIGPRHGLPGRDLSDDAQATLSVSDLWRSIPSY